MGNGWRKQAKRWLVIAVGVFMVLVASGWLLADRLMPRALGAPSTTLPLQPAQTAIDRELAPLLAREKGRSGVILLPEGLDAFAARVMATRQAGRSLDVQYYIWHDDVTGRLLARELWMAAKRGVRVRLLLDDMNAVSKDAKWLALDGHPNVEIRLYNPFRNRAGIERVAEMLQRLASINHRMHNKAWIADGRAAIVGGRNIGVEYFDASEEANFRDLDALVFGPVVAQASHHFDTYWNSAAVIPMSALRRKQGPMPAEVVAAMSQESRSAEARKYLQRVASRDSLKAYAEGGLSPHWSANLRIVADPPIKRGDQPREGWMVDGIREQLLTTQHQALLISPYFVPGEATTRYLVDAAASGKQIGIITNSLAANDVVAVHGGYAKRRETLLRGNVQLHELKPRAVSAAGLGSSGASLHTKAYVLDGRRGFIGSFNLDPRSAYLNTEMGLMFDDPAIAAGVREQYLRLSSPEASYWVDLDGSGHLRWLDRAPSPPRLHRQEPGAGWMRRWNARLMGWLPIESQL